VTRPDRRAPARCAARWAALPAALALLACCPSPALAAGDRTVVADDGYDGACTFGGKNIPGTPWSLQRVLLDQLWRYGKGKGVRVAVIDSGVDDHNPQLKGAVDATDGVNVLSPGGNGTDDQDGHGTEVAGIIAARPMKGTGFVGLAPQATIIPIQEVDAEGGGHVDDLATAIGDAVARHAQVINISQGGADTSPGLESAVAGAIAHGVVVVASAGNDGANGAVHVVYPAAIPGVLAVGASDRDDDRADFSQAGSFVGVSAPGVDMVSDVPGSGQCVDNGTSFAAPYVAAVAALIRGKHPDWSVREVVAQIEQTAERPGRGRTDALGWGVVDPVKALTDDPRPIESPVPDPPLTLTGPKPQPAAFTLNDAAQQRAERDAVYALAAGLLTIGLIAGGAVTVRDAKRRRRGAG
jgi:type VII secretion-associated serine protease mycosin